MEKWTLIVLLIIIILLVMGTLSAGVCYLVYGVPTVKQLLGLTIILIFVTGLIALYARSHIMIGLDETEGAN